MAAHRWQSPSLYHLPGLDCAVRSAAQLALNNNLDLTKDCMGNPNMRIRGLSKYSLVVFFFLNYTKMIIRLYDPTSNTYIKTVLSHRYCICLAVWNITNHGHILEILGNQHGFLWFSPGAHTPQWRCIKTLLQWREDIATPLFHLLRT